MPFERSHHAAAVVGSAIYVLGGISNGASTVTVLKFDGMQGIWSEVAPMPERRDSIMACVVGSSLHVFGGEEDEVGNAQTSVFNYDTEANEWSTTLTPMPVASSGHNASTLGGLVYIVGAGEDNLQVLSFDPASGAWRTHSPGNFSMEYGASFMTCRCLYAVAWSEEGPSVERYDVVTDTWTAAANLLEGRDMCCAVTIDSASPIEEEDLFDSLITKATRHQLL
jgi:hypothetical protein